MSKEILKEIKELNTELKQLHKEMFVQMITEGVDDPGILKCIFLAGGPGSGKSYAAADIFGITKELAHQSFAQSGLKVISSDTAYEKLLKDNGINPKDLAKIEKEEPEIWNNLMRPGGIRSKAKHITQAQKEFYEAGRLGMIIDGTGDEVYSIMEKKKEAEELGYDTYMVFVNTSLDVALERNAKRDRTLPESLVRDIWSACQNNLGKFQHIFNGRFIIVDNTVAKPIAPSISKALTKFINLPVQNAIGKKWILNARALKNANLIKK